jgi:hypothetical protein
MRMRSSVSFIGLAGFYPDFMPEIARRSSLLMQCGHVSHQTAQGQEIMS